MYKVLRNILFLFPPEWSHYFSMNCMRLICSTAIGRLVLRKMFVHHSSSQTIHFGGLSFKNPVGLGAGFDKNAKYLRELECLGFGFVEIGTVTPLPQKGNEKPRLFRLPDDKALINRMGFNNDGAKVVAERLKKWRDSRQRTPDGNREGRGQSVPGFLIGGNIGKNKSTLNEEAWKDYEICFKELHHYVDYFVVNVSSPNTPGLRELQEKESLRKILLHLQMINNGKAVSKPILLKIAPDLTEEQVDDVIDLAIEIKLDGIVATNTTIRRAGLSAKSEIQSTKAGAGGLSGLPLKDASTKMVEYISRKSKNEIPIIASGGIFTGQDAKEKILAGASLVQVWTGFIYEGPAIAKRIIRQLINLKI